MPVMEMGRVETGAGVAAARHISRRAEDGVVIPTRWMVALLGLCAIVVAAMMHHDDLVIDPLSTGFRAIAGAILALLALRYIVRGEASLPQACLKDFCENVLMFMAIVLLGVLASYPTASSSSGFVDDRLAHMDALLHFRWIGWYGVVVAHPLLERAGMVAYAMIFVSPAILLGYFALTGKRAEARRFLLTFWLAALITLLIFPLIPARGPLAFLWHGPIPYMPTSGLYQQQLIPQLRQHALHDIDLGALRGLVCAPSFHTVSAVLYMATAWPIVRLRWPILAINLAMLLSTPVEGNHYLTDMLAGLGIALLAIWMVRVLLNRLPRPAPLRNMATA